LNEEYGIAKKKKQALDSLFERGKISKSTHESFNAEIIAAIEEIEKQQKELGQRMQQKTQELENQIKTLEILLANYEIQYVAGEIDDNTYQLEINLLGGGLDTAKRELLTVQDAVNQLCGTPLPETAIDKATPVMEAKPELTIESPEPIIEQTSAAPIIEETSFEQPIAAEIVETPIDTVSIVESTPIDQPAEIIAEAPVVEEPVVEEPIAEAPVVEEPVVEEPTSEFAPVFEEAIIEQQVDVFAEESFTDVAADQDIATPEPVAEAEEVQAEKVPLDEFDVPASEIVQRDLTQIVEELTPENPREALVAAQEDVIVETPQEACEETQQMPLHCAKETLHEAYSDSENKE
jgi:polyhydroxyalkanoate synthesis regulator phasin